MTCPYCHTEEIYKITLHHEWMYDDDGDIIYGDTIIDYSLVKFGKYDTPDEGKYECVNGHEIRVESEIITC